MVLNSQRTLYGVSIQLATLLNQPYTPLPNTTLNEKFLIQPQVNIPNGVYPAARYYTIGIGGNLKATNVAFSYSEHTATDAALYEHVPFVIKPLNSDLTLQERLKYRFRKILNINGDEYAAYYLKVIPNITLPSSLYVISTNNGLHKLSILDTNTNDMLNPVPRDKAHALPDYVNIDYITKSAKLEFSLTVDEIAELKNVFTLLYNEDKLITEIGVCSGIDSEPDANGDIEANNVQIAFHVGVDIDTTIYTTTSSDIVRSIEIGGVEPYIK